MTDVVAAILVGGESRRMGTDKALLSVGGRPMIEWVAEAAEEVTSQVVAIGREEVTTGIAAFPDLPTSHGGTLAGLATALAHASGSVLLLAVDQPFVRPATLRQLVDLEGPGPKVPVDAEVRQVTCAVYPQSLAEAAARELRAGGSIQSLLGHVAHHAVLPEVWQTWGEDGRSWFSVDTPEALAEGIRRYASSH